MRHEIIQRFFPSHVVYQSGIQKNPTDPCIQGSFCKSGHVRLAIERFYQRISRSASSDVKKRDSIFFLYKFGILNGISDEINYRRCSESLRAHVSWDLSKWRICLEVLRVCPHTNRISSLTAITRSANDSIK